MAQAIQYDTKVTMQLGTNDLSFSTSLKIGSAIENFMHLLHNSYVIKCVSVCQTNCPRSAKEFNKKVDT